MTTDARQGIRSTCLSSQEIASCFAILVLTIIAGIRVELVFFERRTCGRRHRCDWVLNKPTVGLGLWLITGIAFF